MRKPLKRYRVHVGRVLREGTVIEVEAENEERARRKAEYKADNGDCDNWHEGDRTIEAERVEEVKP